MIIHITDDAHLKKLVTESEKPVVVDMWAPWCAPCRVVGAMLDDLDKKDGGLPFVLAKLNVDDNPESAGALQVRSIPTLILFQDGQPAKTHVGALSEDDLLSWAADA